MSNLSKDWAEVRANDRVMRYRRTGMGRAIVVLLPGDAEPPWPELIDALRLSFRVILPEPPVADSDIADWLADFLEGLGASNVRIVAADRFCIPILELTLLGLDQVARVALVPRDPQGEDRVGGTLEAATGQSAVPLIVIRDGKPIEEIVPLITGFLAA